MSSRKEAPALGVLLSGSGRTLQNFLDRIQAGTMIARIACVISSREDVRGVQRARDAGLPTFVSRDTEEIYDVLRRHEVDLVCMCGYMRLLPIAADFAGRVLNIHPALLPKFGGKGYYGDRVHAAVLEAGEAETGCTVHVADDQYDHGPIILQKRVPVKPGDTVKSLAARVFEAECEAYPEAVARFWH